MKLMVASYNNGAGSTTAASLHMRHFTRSNMAFADGHAALLGVTALVNDYKFKANGMAY